MSVVTHPNDVTPTWLTRVLNTAGYTGTVETVSWQPIGAGQVGDNARFEISGSGELPKTVVGKFPAEDPTSKQTGILLQNYAREVFFYSELAATVDIQTPRVFTTEFDPQSHDFVVLMEDLAPGAQVDQMSHCTLAQAELALLELAKLHGPRWNDPELEAYPLLNAPAEGNPEEPLYNMLKDGFLERYGNRLEASEQQAVNDFAQVIPAYSNYVGPRTLIHIDYRSDNMIFGGPYPLTVLDWQSINLGCALNDTSYFMGTSMDPQQRAANEQSLLQLYLETLQGYGVELDWATCWSL